MARTKETEAELRARAERVTDDEMESIVMGDEGCSECGGVDLEPISADDTLWRCNECQALYLVVESEDGDDEDGE